MPEGVGLAYGWAPSDARAVQIDDVTKTPGIMFVANEHYRGAYRRVRSSRAHAYSHHGLLASMFPKVPVTLKNCTIW